MKIKEPFLRTPHNYDRDQASNEAGLECKDPSLTKQADAKDADINEIVRRFNLTGQLPANVRMPTYGDFTDVPTYHQAANAIRAADEAFAAMPAHVRARFHNDAGEFVDFCSKEENYEEAAKLGLLTPKPAPQEEKTLPPAPSGGEGGGEEPKKVEKTKR